MAARAAIAARRSANTWSSPPEDVMRHLIPQSCCSDGFCVYACGLAGHRRGEIARGETKRPRNKFTVIADMLAATAAAPKRPGQHTVVRGGAAVPGADLGQSRVGGAWSS
jgi:hypothetical protein